jgi:hypothetical protein
LKLYVPQAADARERNWCAAAWPSKYGRDARFTFVYWISGELPGGKLAKVKDSRYSGWGNGPSLKEIFSGVPFKSDLAWGEDFD